MQQFQITTGTAEAVEATEDVTVLAAPGAGKRYRIISICVAVTLAATGGTGEVALEDGVGGSRFFEADADAVGVYTHYFGEEGYPLSVDTLLNITVDGAGTNQASARATVVAKLIG